MDTTKVNKIHQIVRLRQMLRKWQKLATVEKRLTTLGSALSPRRRRSPFSYASDDEGSNKPPAVPPDVPEGFLAVYVGKERRRFIVRTDYLNHPLFRALLQKSEEEFGFVHHGGVTIPCEAVFFEHLLWLLDKNDALVQRSELQELLDFYYTDMHECSTEASLMEAHFLTSERSSLLHATAQESSG